MTALCAEYGISRETGYKWVARYRAGGLAALADGSHVRHALPPGIPDEIATLILTMRGRRPFCSQLQHLRRPQIIGALRTSCRRHRHHPAAQNQPQVPTRTDPAPPI